MCRWSLGPPREQRGELRVLGAGPGPPSTPGAQCVLGGGHSEATPSPGGHKGQALAQGTLPIGGTGGLTGPSARRPTRPPRGASCPPGGPRRPAGAGTRCGRAGGWFGPARTPPPRAARCNPPWAQKHAGSAGATPTHGWAAPTAPGAHQYGGFGTAVSRYRSSSSVFFCLKYCGDGRRW